MKLPWKEPILRLILVASVFLVLLTLVVKVLLNPQWPKEQENQRAVELLFVGDPFALVMEARSEEISRQVGEPLRLSIRRYARTYETMLSNAKDESSYFHLVSFDILWLPDLVNRGVLAPLPVDKLIKKGFRPADHHPATLQFNQYQDRLYGLPIQTHPELLWYRRDLLEEADLTPPQTLDELLEQARFFHRPEEGFYGICWNALRGQALGQTVTHLYAAFGQPIIDESGGIHIDNEAGQQVALFLRELLAVSPPDILAMAWDQRIERFSRGQAAFTYGWMARSSAAERDPLSRVRGNVAFSPPPGHVPDHKATPMGQWSLGIPANLDPAEHDRALRVLAALVSRQTEKILHQENFFGHHLLWEDQVLAAAPPSSGGRVVQEILANHLFDPGARPSLQNWSALADILGVLFHDYLQNKLTLEEVLQMAQEEAEEKLGPTP